MADAPMDLYIATYSDPDAAQQDWDDIKQLARDDVITVDGLVLVSRDADGKIDVKDNAHDVGKGAALGAVGGAVIGLIFPPAFLASAVVGAGVGGALPAGSSTAGEEGDQGRHRGRAPTGQLGHRCAVRGALGPGCGEGAREVRKGRQARSRRRKRRGRQDNRLERRVVSDEPGVGLGPGAAVARPEPGLAPGKHEFMPSV